MEERDISDQKYASSNQLRLSGAGEVGSDGAAHPDFNASRFTGIASGRTSVRRGAAAATSAANTSPLGHSAAAVRNVTTVTGPFVEVTEQPRSRGMRFRYECEGRSAGSIPGERSTKDKKSFPSIRVRNATGAGVIVISCVSKDSPHTPHPHSLVGKANDYECKDGVCTWKVKDVSQILSFPNLGVQCAKKKDVSKALAERQKLRVDPFRTGFTQDGDKEIDLNVVRLCWQVFLADTTGKFTKIVPPVVSNVIYDKKSVNDLVICRMNRSAGNAHGGDEVYLLCEKVSKDDIEVRFHEEDVDGITCWESFGVFAPSDVHHQHAIVFKTPPYRDQRVPEPVNVSLHLRRKSDKESSDSVPFTYMPHDDDPDGIDERRKRKKPSHDYYRQDNKTYAVLLSPAVATPGDTRDRLRQTILDRQTLKQDTTDRASCSFGVPATVFGEELPYVEGGGNGPFFAELTGSGMELPMPSVTTGSIDTPGTLFGLTSQDFSSYFEAMDSEGGLLQAINDPLLSAVGTGSATLEDVGTTSIVESIGTALERLASQPQPISESFDSTLESLMQAGGVGLDTLRNFAVPR